MKVPAWLVRGLFPLYLACSAQATTAPDPVVTPPTAPPTQDPRPAAEPTPSAKVAASVPVVIESPASAPASMPTIAYPGMPIDPSWPQEVYIMTDSVVLGAKPQLEKSFKALGWKMILDGRPAIMLPPATKEIKKRPTLPPIAVIAIGYNTLWERDRKNYNKWAERFDKHAETLYQTLTERGVKKVIWVMLREISEENIPMKHAGARRQLEKAGFYFPYVNERLKAMRERHPGMALVDWPTVGFALGHTYDAIHVNSKGAWVMADEIVKTVGLTPAPREEKKKELTPKSAPPKTKPQPTAEAPKTAPKP